MATLGYMSRKKRVRGRIKRLRDTVELGGWLVPCEYCGTLTSKEILFFLFKVRFTDTKKIACCQRCFNFKKYTPNITPRKNIPYRWSPHLNLIAVF